MKVLDALIGGGDEEFVVIFVSGRKPGCGTFGENALQKSGAAPLIKIGVVAENGLQDEFEGGAASTFEKGNDDRVRIGDAVPVFGECDKFLRA